MSQPGRATGEYRRAQHEAAAVSPPAPAITISRRGKAQRAAGFERLRAHGIELLQKTSGATWTDHNLHDPGITMLEALCYALTEVAFRTEFPVADLLTPADGQIPFETLSLHPPQDAFPCGATTADDVRRLLLDRVEGLDDARLERAGGGPKGIYTLWLKLVDADVAERTRRQLAALSAYRAERSLGEDVRPAVIAVAHRLVQLHARIEIQGAHDAAEVLADIYHQAAVYIDRGARLQSRMELLEQGLTLEQIYDGPAVQQGFATDVGPQEPGEQLYVGDLVRHIVEHVDGVKEVRSLSLAVAETAERSSETLTWRDVTWALCLDAPGQADGSNQVHVTLWRRNQIIEVDHEELKDRVQNLNAVARARRKRQQDDLAKEEAASLPRGRHRPPAPYRSVQFDFPPIYGLGVNGVPPGEGALRIAQSRQLRGYLLMFEQVIANAREQTAHLGPLYSGAAARRQTYWWAALDDEQAPGSGELYTAPPQTIAQAMLLPLDRGAARRHQLLDHLLALQGEDFSQNAMRQYCGHLDGAELDALLLDNKAAYLQDIVPLSRHRARGFDYSQPLWDSPGHGNNSSLTRRVSLMLGFRHDHARSLTQLLAHNGLTVSADAIDLPRLPGPQAESGEALVLRPRGAAKARDGRPLLARLGLGRGKTLPGALLRAAVAHDGYRVVLANAPGEQQAAAVSLALHDASLPIWWNLGRFKDSAEATAAAQALRDAALKLDESCEGLHLVEHVLLWPLQGPAPVSTPAPSPRAVPASFFDLRLTAVLPDWTVRTQQSGFRLLAKQTLHINCPAHLQLEVLWLDPARMQAFEADFGHWLDLRRRHCLPQDQVQYADAAAVDAAARALIAHLVPTVTAVAGDEGVEEDG